MKVNNDQIVRAVEQYFENEILPKAPTSFEKFKIGFVYGALKNKLPKIILELKNSPMLQMTEIIDADGLIDAELMMQYAKESIQKSGKILIGNVTLDNTDIDKLYSYLV